MGRRSQCFVADVYQTTGPYAGFCLREDDLPLRPSPWHCAGRARMPLAHWVRLLQWAYPRDPAGVAFFQTYAAYALHPPELPAPRGADLVPVLGFLDRLGDALAQAAPLIDASMVVAVDDSRIDLVSYDDIVDQIPIVVWEDLPNWEYRRMCQAVTAVLERCLAWDVPLYAYID